jgi:Domain of unknown function (DUF4124)
MRIFIIQIVACASLCAAVAVHAQVDKASSYRYRWHDAQGQTHYSDSLNAEAFKYGYDVVNDQGVSVQHVERQLTPDEQIAAKKLADQRAADEQVALEKKRADSQMLSAYPTEASFAAARSAEMDNLEQTVQTTRANLQSQEKALTDLLSRAGELERAKQPVSKILNDRIAEQRSVVAHLRTTLDRQQAAKVTAQQQADAQLAHYRELRAAQKEQGN